MARAAGEERERELSWLDYSDPGDVSAEGKWLLFNEEGDGGGHNYSIFLPDDRRILFSGSERGDAMRDYLQDIEGGKPRPITLEGGVSVWRTHPLSPDGKSVIALDPDGKLNIFPTDGEGRQPALGTLSGDVPVRWGADGHSAFVTQGGEIPAKVYRLDFATQTRRIVAELSVPDRTGLTGIRYIQMTPDGKSYAYTFSRFLTELCVIEGLK